MADSRQRVKREISEMHRIAKDWRRPELQQVEGPNDLKIYGGTIAYDIERWADMMASLDNDVPRLTVWYGDMPETNGRSNWTAILRRVDPIDKWDQGFCFARSEYPDRVRYEADRMRWIIGELEERPDILAYDPDLHSGYVPPVVTPWGYGFRRKSLGDAWSFNRSKEQADDILGYSDGEVLPLYKEPQPDSRNMINSEKYLKALKTAKKIMNNGSITDPMRLMGVMEVINSALADDEQ